MILCTDTNYCLLIFHDSQLRYDISDELIEKLSPILCVNCSPDDAES